MAGIITTAGLAAEVAAKAANKSFRPSYIQLGTGRYTPAASRTAIMTPFSPVKQFSAANIRSASNTLYADFVDSTLTAAYSYGELGVFYTDGTNTVLYYVESTPTGETILGSKQSGTQKIFTAAISSLNSVTGTFSLSPFVGLPAASETVSGVIELANSTEGNAGTDTARAMTAARVKGYIDSRRPSKSVAEAGTDNTKVMTPLRTKEAIDALGSSPTDASETTKGIVELANSTEANAGTSTSLAMSPARVDGYIDNRIASQSEAQTGTDTSKLMTPQRVDQYVDNRRASQSEAQTGTNSDKLMTPARVDDYVDNRIATQTEAETGTDTSKLMTPQRTKQAIDNSSGVTRISLATGNSLSNTTTNITLSSAYTNYDQIMVSVVYSTDRIFNYFIDVLELSSISRPDNHNNSVTSTMALYYAVPSTSGYVFVVGRASSGNTVIRVSHGLTVGAYTVYGYKY